MDFKYCKIFQYKYQKQLKNKNNKHEITLQQNKILPKHISLAYVNFIIRCSRNRNWRGFQAVMFPARIKFQSHVPQYNAKSKLQSVSKENSTWIYHHYWYSYLLMHILFMWWMYYINFVTVSLHDPSIHAEFN